MKNIMFVFMLFAAVLASAEGTPISLKQALNDGLKGNLDIQRAELGTESIDAQVSAAFRQYLPQLSASGSVTRQFRQDPTIIPNYQSWITALAGGEFDPKTAIIKVPVNWAVTGDITLSQFLYVPQALTGISMAKKGKEIDALGKTELKEGIIYGIAMQYWTIVYMEENLSVLQKSNDNLGKTREVIASMVAQGVAKKSDLNTMDINLASLSTQIDNLKVQIQTQKDGLLQIMGQSPGKEIVLTDRLNVDTRNSVNESGDPIQSSVTLKRMQQQIMLQEMQMDLTSQTNYPSIVAFASYGTQAGGEKFDFYKDPTDKFSDDGAVGINVTIPLFDGFSTRAQVSVARIQKRQLEMDMEKEKLSLQATYQSAKSTFVNAQILVERNKENATLAEENYIMKEMEYKEQVAPITDLLTADNDMQTARSNLINALYTEKTAELALEQVLGILRNRVE